jgi:hypothetical protein
MSRCNVCQPDPSFTARDLKPAKNSYDVNTLTTDGRVLIGIYHEDRRTFFRICSDCLFKLAKEKMESMA